MTANEKEIIHERIKKYAGKLELTIKQLNNIDKLTIKKLGIIDKEVALMKQNVEGLEKEMSFHVGEIKESIKSNILEVRGALKKLVEKEETKEKTVKERRTYYTRTVVVAFIILSIGFIFGQLTKGF